MPLHVVPRRLCYMTPQQRTNKTARSSPSYNPNSAHQQPSQHRLPTPSHLPSWALEALRAAGAERARCTPPASPGGRAGHRRRVCSRRGCPSLPARLTLRPFDGEMPA
eukprot:scaffold12011_cov101-Isochrysis_galbana.AAC.1